MCLSAHSLQIIPDTWLTLCPERTDWGRIPAMDIAAALARVRIGDCYMAACGVLHEIDDPATMIEFAKNLRAIVRDYGEALGYPLDVRIGIGYGQVISGVIGREKKTFDLWGETVNLASRMESTGTSGRIQGAPACGSQEVYNSRATGIGVGSKRIDTGSGTGVLNQNPPAG